jgi:hypothetical protein
MGFRSIWKNSRGGDYVGELNTYGKIKVISKLHIHEASKMTTPMGYIEDIKNRQIKSDKEFVLDSLTGAIDRLQKAFPRYGSFLMEFVQNADDAKSQSLKIEILENTIRIFNDGLPFSEEDVKSICKVGRSSKTPKDCIGYLGVGFKSAFLISECPEIYSGGFRFKFDKDVWDDPFHTPWQVMPLWIENPSIEFSGKYNTVFNLYLKELKLLEKLKEEVKPDHLSDRILLFLRNVEKIEIIDHTQNLKRKIIKSMSSKTSGYEIYQIQEYEDDILKNQDHWLIFRSIGTVPEDVKEDFVTKEWDRENIEKREVLAAFKLDEENNLTKEEKGTAHIGVFSFLPLKEVLSGLNFLMQADFLTTPGRGELARESLWNNWLADEICNLIVGKCVPTFLSHKNETWKLNFTEILYSSGGGHELFEQHIKRPIRQYMENEAVLIAEDGSAIKQGEAVHIPPEVRGLLSENDLDVLYPGKKVLHPDCSAPWEIKTRIAAELRFNASSGLSDKMQELLILKSKEKNMAFFKSFYYECLLHYRNSSPSTKSKLKSHNIFLTDNWNLTNTHSLYINPKDLAIPQTIKDNFKIIHPELIAEPDILDFLKMLGISELTEERIQDILRPKVKAVREIGETWVSLSDEEKIKKTKVCKELYERHEANAGDLEFLTLKSKGGVWLKPVDLVFSNEYGQDHRIEELTGKGLLKSEDLQRLNINFLSHEYIAEDDQDIKSWRDFFEKLGLEQNLKKEKLVERIGINTALRFEKEKGRKAKELSHSEEFGGYDIESNSGERLIEVKGRSDPMPQIWLTHKQIKKLHEEGEKYFLYVVRDALRNPVLTEIKGHKLLDVDYSISIDFYKWKDLSEVEFQP